VCVHCGILPVSCLPVARMYVQRVGAADSGFVCFVMLQQQQQQQWVLHLEETAGRQLRRGQGADRGLLAEVCLQRSACWFGIWLSGTTSFVILVCCLC
jgi:hypothetical protein